VALGADAFHVFENTRSIFESPGLKALCRRLSDPVA
jgi:hypothetical protein